MSIAVSPAAAVREMITAGHLARVIQIAVPTWYPGPRRGWWPYYITTRGRDRDARRGA